MQTVKSLVVALLQQRRFSCKENSDTKKFTSYVSTHFQIIIFKCHDVDLNSTVMVECTAQLTR